MRLFHVVTLAVANVFVVNASDASAGEIPSALAIAKSTNKNQVHYAVRVDGECNPAGPSPVHPYWRMLERSADATEPLAAGIEERAFGIERQSVDGDDVRFVLRGLPSRDIVIHTNKTPEGSCASSATMTIAGEHARVTSVFVKQKLFGVDYVELAGTAPSGAALRERIKI